MIIKIIVSTVVMFPILLFFLLVALLSTVFGRKKKIVHFSSHLTTFVYMYSNATLIYFLTSTYAVLVTAIIYLGIAFVYAIREYRKNVEFPFFRFLSKLWKLFFLLSMILHSLLLVIALLTYSIDYVKN